MEFEGILMDLLEVIGVDRILAFIFAKTPQERSKAAYDAAYDAADKTADEAQKAKFG